MHLTGDLESVNDYQVELTSGEVINITGIDFEEALERWGIDPEMVAEHEDMTDPADNYFVDL